jgi:serine kinase of HPr protein (carbohydrate metabolism regulator)
MRHDPVYYVNSTGDWGYHSSKNVPSITIPVKPGRNLAIILEIAAMNHRQKKMGYNTAEEFNRKLIEQMSAEHK